MLAGRERGTTPWVRDARGKRRPVNWQEATELFCRRLQDIQARHGRDSVAFLSTGQIATEEMALLGTLAKFGLGMVHGDGNTRQCMATAVVAYKQAFGFDAPPYTYQDFEESDVIVLIGSNLCIAHPIMWQRVLNNPHRPEIIVLDPRRTETAMAATQHVALRPKTDLPLLYGLAHILLHENWIDREYIQAHTSGFDEFSAHLAQFTPDQVAEVSGVEAHQLRHIARTIHQGQRVSFWWTMGVNQSYQGVRTAQAIINLALITGNIGRPGTGANSITGQCNAMGSRLFSNTTNLLGGHDFQNLEHREKVAEVLGIDQERVPTENSWSYDRIIEGILRDEIKGLWVICTNPAHSWINQNTCEEILDRLDFLVVQDMYHSTETAQRADLYLPAAGWGEKEGTFINSERRHRTDYQEGCQSSPGQALSDFSIFRLIAALLGLRQKCLPNWTNRRRTVFHNSQGTFPGSALRHHGRRRLPECSTERGGVQWPYPEGAEKTLGAVDCQVGHDIARQRRLFADGQVSIIPTVARDGLYDGSASA